MLKIIESPVLSEGLRSQLKSVSRTALVILGGDNSWRNALLCKDPVVDWGILTLDPAEDWLEKLTHHPQLRGGGWLWDPDELDSKARLPQRWRRMSPPWSWLGRWMLQGFPLRSLHVGLLAPPSARLESLVGWLQHQGAGVSWLGEHSLNLVSLSRVFDCVLVFPGFQRTLEMHFFNPGVTIIDFRLKAEPLSRGAWQMLLGSFADASSGALQALLPALVFSQQD